MRLPVILLCLSLTGCLTRRAADVLTTPRRVVEAGHWEKETATKPARFEIEAADGIVLSALELPADPTAPKLGTAYLFHGFGNTKEQMLPVAKPLAAAGFRCIAWDSRGHGRSGGERASYGMREVDDARRVIKAARKRDSPPARQRGLLGLLDGRGSRASDSTGGVARGGCRAARSLR